MARVEWRLQEQDLRTARVLATAVAGEFERLGLGIVRLADWLEDEDPAALSQFRAAWHHLGTTRMHDDPKQGVVDSDCALHGVARLFVCGGSVFPAGGVANPTLTMTALAIRLADRLKAEELS
jgi:choline dehydrogenase-like flavoprotein